MTEMDFALGAPSAQVRAIARARRARSRAFRGALPALWRRLTGRRVAPAPAPAAC